MLTGIPDQDTEAACLLNGEGTPTMMALRLPFVSRLMVFEVRLERICSRNRIPVLVSERTLRDLHQERQIRSALLKDQVELERQRLFAGSFRLR